MAPRPPALGRDGDRGTLYVVATPIGNLGDVTLRALETLRSVPLIAAEDTRITRRLLARYEIPTRAISYHARSGPSRQEELLAHLRGGADLALVSDAGTPVISDPGGELVAAWAGEGGRVVPIPGPSSVLSALSASGVAGPRWSFEGSLPRSGGDRRERLAGLAADARATVIFEAPTRLAATLRDLAAACGADRAAAVCRELTKVHEQIARGTLAELVLMAGDGSVPARGEVVLVVGGRDASAAPAPGGETQPAAATLDEGRVRVEALVADGVPRSEAARRVASETGLSRRELYRAP